MEIVVRYTLRNVVPRSEIQLFLLSSVTYHCSDEICQIKGAKDFSVYRE